MCVCRPEVRTPFCGRRGCTWPKAAAPAGAATPRAETDPEWIRGACPSCGEPVISNCYYETGRGYLIVWECAASLGDAPSCDYRRVL